MKILSTSHNTNYCICNAFTATSLLVLQRYLSAIRLYTHSIQTPSNIQSGITRPLQCQRYPGIAIGDKDSCESHSQLIKPCSSLSSHAYQWLQLRLRKINKINMHIIYDLRLIIFTIYLFSCVNFSWIQLTLKFITIENFPIYSI